MRRLTWTRNRSGESSERGAAGVIVAVMMLVLIGAGAVAVDVGQIYSERAQLQNGADAGALAVANSCQPGPCAPALAGPLANANSNDNVSNASVSLSIPGEVTVRTSTKNGSSSFLSKMFSSVLSAGPISVVATATAAWGGPLAGPAALPIALAPCQINATSGVRQYLYLKDPPPAYATCQGDGSTGHVTGLPGGFHFAVLDDASSCSASVKSLPDKSGYMYLDSNTGINVPNPCKTLFANELNKVVLFPVYSGVTGNGAGGKYIIEGWAAFKLEGYRFNGGVSGGVAVPGGSNSRGIAGTFVEWVADPAVYSGGGYSQGGTTLPPHLVK